MSGDIQTKFYGKSDYWDKRHGKAIASNHQGKIWTKDFLSIIAGVKARKVIDLGCGRGDGALLLAENGYEVTGIDFSVRAIEHAIDKSDKMGLSVNFFDFDLAKKLPFKDNYFDMAVSNMVLHSFPPMILSEVIKEIKRIIKPGGYLLFHANSIKDLPLRTKSQGVVTQLSRNFFELKGGQSIHFLDSDYCFELFETWDSLKLEPVHSLDAKGEILKHAWRGIAQVK